jgi:DNA-binding CsgD family transcriptional regulator
MSDYAPEIVGHSREKYISGGVDFHNSIWVPEDKVVFEQQIFRDIREFWNRIPPQEIPKYRFSFCYRYFRNDGAISHFVQHTNYQEPQYGQPILNLSMFSDIGDYKTDNNMVLTVSHLVNGVGYVKVFSKSYVPERKAILSERESEILRLSLDGMSNKMIAEKLFISLQTVKNHKANMMEKTSTSNITGLINLSLKNKWI